MDGLQRTAPIWLLLDSRVIGGIETHVLALAEGLQAMGRTARVVFLADHGPHPLDPALERSGHPALRLGGGLADLISALRGERPAILHTHGYKAGLLGRLAARLTKTPCVSTFHNGDLGEGRVRIYTLLDRWSARLAQASVAVSAPIAKHLGRHAIEIPNGVPIPARRPDAAGNRIAFVGRLSAEKGPDRLIEVSRSLPDKAIELFGDGPMRSTIEHCSNNRLVLHGAVPSMSPYWAEIGLLIMPSRAEGLPMAALEAMAHGVPVAAMAAGGLPELTGGGRGWCVPQDDIRGLIGAVEEWSAEPLADRFARSKRNFEHIRSHYSRDRMLDRIAAVYRAVA